jgi:acyl dehydratase
MTFAEEEGFENFIKSGFLLLLLLLGMFCCYCCLLYSLLVSLKRELDTYCIKAR